MSDEVKLTEQELAGAAGGVDGDTWWQNGHYMYLIQDGDTLSGIACKYGTTVPALMNLNRDKITNPNLIQAGWIIRIA